MVFVVGKNDLRENEVSLRTLKMVLAVKFSEVKVKKGCLKEISFEEFQEILTQPIKGTIYFIKCGEDDFFKALNCLHRKRFFFGKNKICRKKGIYYLARSR